MTTTKTRFPGRGKRYSATKNGVLSDKQAVAIGAELETAGFDEEPDPHDVLEYAKNNPETVLHSLFQWDNDAAATQYRIWQARRIIGSIQMEVILPNGKSEVVRKYANIQVPINKTQSEQRYVSIDKIAKSPKLSEQTVNKAKRELDAWRRRYKVMREMLEPVYSQVDKFFDDK